MIDCDQAELLLAARVDGGLDGAGGARLTEHLAMCATCRAVGVSVAPRDADGEAHGLPVVDPAEYQLGAELARGGVGRVLVARQRRVGREVAIKELIDPTPALVARFEREARLTARLQHPGIVPIYEIGSWPDGTPFFAMRLVRGQTLGEAIARATSAVARRALLPTLITVCDTVGFAHARGVIHRDLSPANVLCGDHGETVVIDWGLAKDLSEPSPDVAPASSGAGEAPAADPHLTALGTVMGTRAFMAPEQARGEPTDARADVYALGAIIRYALTGRAPLATSDTPLAMSDPPGEPDVTPRELASVVAKATDPEAAARYPDAGALAAELARFVEGRLVDAHAYTAWERLRRWTRRHRRGLVMAALAVSAIVAVVALAFRRVADERDRASFERRRADLRERDAQQAAAALKLERATELLGEDERDRAAPLLVDVLDRLGDDPLLRFLLGRALAGRGPWIETGLDPTRGHAALAVIAPDQATAVVGYFQVIGADRDLELHAIDLRSQRSTAIPTPWLELQPEYTCHPELQLSTDGTRLLVAFCGQVGVWDFESTVWRSTMEVALSASVAFVPGTHDVLAWSSNEDDGFGWLRWDGDSGEERGAGDPPTSGSAVLADGRLVETRYGADDEGDDPIALAVQSPGGAAAALLPTAAVLDWAVSNDGRVVIACDRSGRVSTWRLRDDGALVAGPPIEVAPDALTACAVSPDGARVGAALVPGPGSVLARLAVWDVASGGRVASWDGRASRYDDLAFVAPTSVRAGDHVFDWTTHEVEILYGAVAVSADWAIQVADRRASFSHPRYGVGPVRVIDRRATRPRRERPLADLAATVVAVADGANRGLATSPTGLVAWERGHAPRVLDGLSEPAVVAADGARIAAWNGRDQVVVVDFVGRTLGGLPLAAAPRAVLLSPGGAYLVALDGAGRAHGLEVDRGRRFSLGGFVTGAVVTDDGQAVLCGGEASTLVELSADGLMAPADRGPTCRDGLGVYGGKRFVVDANGGIGWVDRQGSDYGGDTDGPLAIDRSGDLSLGTWGGDVRWWDLTRYSGRPRPAWRRLAPKGEDGPSIRTGEAITALAVAGQRLLVATNAGLWFLWGPRLARFAEPPTGPLRFLSFAADGLTLVGVNSAGEHLTWSLPLEGRPIEVLRELTRDYQPPPPR